MDPYKLFVNIYNYEDAMKTILMLKYGKKYSAQDVNRIVYETGGKYNYTLLTDDSSNLDPRVNVIPIPKEIEGHWIKIWMFSLKDLGDVLYLDLDVRIQKNIDHLWNYIDTVPTIVYTYWKDAEFPEYVGDTHSMRYLSNYNSSVLLWRSGEDGATEIWDTFENNLDYYMVKYWGDDRFLWHENIDLNAFPKGEIYSFVYGADYYEIDDDNKSFKYRPEYTIALLNGLDQFPGADKKYDQLRMH
jgi:hypothetical protein